MTKPTTYAELHAHINQFEKARIVKLFNAFNPALFERVYPDSTIEGLMSGSPEHIRPTLGLILKNTACRSDSGILKVLNDYSTLHQWLHNQNGLISRDFLSIWHTNFRNLQGVGFEKFMKK